MGQTAFYALRYRDPSDSPELHTATNWLATDVENMHKGTWTLLPALGGSYVRGTPPDDAKLSVIAGRLCGTGIVQKADASNFSTSSVIPIVASGGLPVGMRPAAKVLAMSATSNPDAGCRVVIFTDGALSIVTGTAAFSYFELSCINHPIAGVVS